MLKGANQRSHSSVTKKGKKWGREDIENPTFAIDTPIPKQVLENLTEIISLIITLKIYLLKKPLLRNQTLASANKRL